MRSDPNPDFEMRSNPDQISEIWSNPDFKTARRSDPVFFQWSEPDPGKTYPDPKPWLKVGCPRRVDVSLRSNDTNCDRISNFYTVFANV